MDTVSENFVYAGFWRRFNAYGIDATLVLILSYVANLVLGDMAAAQSLDEIKLLNDAATALQTGEVDPALQATAQEALIRSALGGSLVPGASALIAMLVSAIYNIFFVAGDWQATPGKHWLGLKVATNDGQRLTLLQSAIRHAVSGLSMLGFGAGYLTMFFTKNTLALHDILCHTIVIHARKY